MAAADHEIGSEVDEQELAVMVYPGTKKDRASKLRSSGVPGRGGHGVHHTIDLH